MSNLGDDNDMWRAPIGADLKRAFKGRRRFSFVKIIITRRRSPSGEKRAWHSLGQSPKAWDVEQQAARCSEKLKAKEDQRYSCLPLKLDETDTSILKVLMKDGRLSFRQIAAQVGVTTPTVESRVKKMTESGVIKKIAPVLDIDKVEKGVAALMMLKVELAKVNSVVEKLAPLDEVRSIFLSTGQANLIVRVATSSNEAFQDFLSERIALLGVDVVSSEVITRTVKDEQGVALYGEMAVALVCDYCGGEIGGKPFTLNVGEGKRFFCCKTCLSDYKEKYGVHKNEPSRTTWNG